MVGDNQFPQFLLNFSSIFIFIPTAFYHKYHPDKHRKKVIVSGVSRDEMNPVTRFVRKLDLAFEIRDLTKWQLNLISCDQREISRDCSSRLRSRLTTRISGYSDS